MVSRATNVINRCFLIQDQIEQETGARADCTNNYVIPLRDRKVYVYDDFNELKRNPQGRKLTKAVDCTSSLRLQNAGAFVQDTVARNQLAQKASSYYLNRNTNSNQPVNRHIYTPSEEKSIEYARGNPDGNVIVPKEYLSTMKEILEQNRELMKRTNFLKSELDEIRKEKMERRFHSAPQKIQRRGGGR